MTILEKNQPWPQIEDFAFNPSIGVFGGCGYKREIIDRPITEFVSTNISLYHCRHRDKPTHLFVGPRARNKIKELISRDNHLVVDDSTCLKNKFLGLELVFTIDDGLWIA